MRNFNLTHIIKVYNYDINDVTSLRENKYLFTRSSGPYGPFLLAPAEGIWGPFGPPAPHRLKKLY